MNKNIIELMIGMTLVILLFTNIVEAADTTPPKSITNLTNKSYALNYINWTWKDPADIDFTKVMIFINGKFKTNVTKGKRYYNLTGLLPNTLHTISTHTVDTSGNINKTWVNKSARTKSDSKPPKSITNLTNKSYAPNYINWTWKDPSDIDFTKVMIFINGKFKTNVTKGKRYYNATGLISNTSYRISTHTVDTSGNINKTWVNKTSKTSPIAKVNISGSAFKPSTLNITKGTTVIWTNLDVTDHTVTSDTGVFGSGNIAQGESFSFIFNTAESFSYHCDIHFFMKGKINVK